MIEILAWSGSIAFALSAFPQSYKCYKDGNADGLSNGLLYLWSYGELVMLITMYPKMMEILPIYVNYILNFVALLIILRYKIWRRK